MSSISSHGYVLIYVGKTHHLADVRGYAYEHRLVAEKKIGRRLRKGEEVHHLDENKQNNHPSNLSVKKSHRHHLVEHRKTTNKKLPDQKNVTIKCACGCGKRFKKYDASNRPRKYVSGHNPVEAKTRTAIIDCLNIGAATVADLKKHGFSTPQGIKVALSKMTKLKIIKRISHGTYSLP